MQKLMTSSFEDSVMPDFITDLFFLPVSISIFAFEFACIPTIKTAEMTAGITQRAKRIKVRVKVIEPSMKKTIS